MEFADPDVGAWVFDLIARDDLVRQRALRRHQELVARSLNALHWSNRVWMQAGTPAPQQPHLAAEMDQARADQRRHRGQTIFGYLDAFLDADPRDTATRAVYWPFVVPYLKWETRYPDEWRSPNSNLWSPWTRKEVVLGELGRRGVPEEMRPNAADLIITAIQRPYRCKDWMYALMVPHVADTEFHDRVTALTRAHDPFAQLRAQFIIDLVRHPERKITRKTWRRWLQRQDDA
ncbi:hypothetical protein SK803_28695 [Lentzea sp. BCCO 10_0856]|uniref:3-methyladenine DNA glycosylase AlkD n=1 Tax=Lentzea miocenica TaxID=3095431 RepID=A0ABU4T7S0_9PSEU|nr:hypothetical protein [Lentzea sp. BCCO 10_0856]MDX8034214.1 hypothetical protein [Lentzea sp. BCCO 10_0856]